MTQLDIYFLILNFILWSVILNKTSKKIILRGPMQTLIFSKKEKKSNNKVGLSFPDVRCTILDASYYMIYQFIVIRHSNWNYFFSSSPYLLTRGSMLWTCRSNAICSSCFVDLNTATVAEFCTVILRAQIFWLATMEISRLLILDLRTFMAPIEGSF